MTDFRAILATLRRPRLLIRAARLGMEDYRRDRDLGRLTDCASPNRRCRACWNRRMRWNAPAFPAMRPIPSPVMWT